MSEPLKGQIGEISGGEYHLRGQAITRLMSETDFLSVIWLTWTGVLPTEPQRRILGACFVACVDHGEAPPSAQAARIVASCGKPLADAVAAGILTLGPRHGNAAGAASAWMREAIRSGHSADMVVAQAFEEKRRLPGLGHPEYDVDPRAMKLFEIAKAALPTMPHTDLALEVSRVFSTQKGKALPVNIDGALGAVVADMDAPSELADAIFIASRTVGLVAHARDEAAHSITYRRA